MREIEFRAKAINREPKYKYRTNYKNDDWVYGLLTRLRIGTSFGILPAQMTNERGVSGIDVDIETLGQYTGLKDKSGKKIFEGDIILLEEEKMYGLVCFEYGRWYVLWYGWIDKEGIGCVYDIVNENPLYDELIVNEEKIWMNVVGNKWDNPEFLKGEKIESICS